MMFGSLDPRARIVASDAASLGVGTGAPALYAVPNALVNAGGWPCLPRIGCTVKPRFGKFRIWPVVPVTEMSWFGLTGCVISFAMVIGAPMIGACVWLPTVAVSAMWS